MDGALAAACSRTAHPWGLAEKQGRPGCRRQQAALLGHTSRRSRGKLQQVCAWLQATTEDCDA